MTCQNLPPGGGKKQSTIIKTKQFPAQQITQSHNLLKSNPNKYFCSNGQKSLRINIFTEKQFPEK